MRLSRFYVEEDLSAGQIYALGTDLTHYLRNVLRVKPGDKIMLFNGQGGEYLAQIEAVSKKEVSAIVIQFEPSNRESELHLCLGVSVVKRDAMDTIIQKSTELGVSEIQPLIPTSQQFRQKPSNNGSITGEELRSAPANNADATRCQHFIARSQLKSGFRFKQLS